MKKDICFILLFLFVTASSAFAQLIGFESSEVPEAFKTERERRKFLLFSIKRVKVAWSGISNPVQL